MSGNRNGRSPRSVALVGPYSSGKSTLVRSAAGGGRRARQAPRRSAQPPDDHRDPRSAIAPTWATRGRSWTAPARSNSPTRPCAALAMVDIAVVVCEPDAGQGRHGRAAAEDAARTKASRTSCSSTRSTRWTAASPTRSPPCRRYAAVPLVLRQMPIFEGQTVTGYVDLMSERAYRYRKGQASELMQIPAGDARRGSRPRWAGWWKRWPIMTTRCWKRCWRTSSRRPRNSTATCARTCWPAR